MKDGTLSMESDSQNYSALIVEGNSFGEVKHHYNSGNLGDNGAFSGNITYNRYVNSLSNGSGWDLIGSPVSGLSISSFASVSEM